MSTLQMQGLGVLSTDDPMETDADRRVGHIEDIDIDIDLAGEQQHDGEDEYMSEGVTALNEQTLRTSQQTGDAYNDDEMADDGDPGEAVVDSASLQDEDLQDAEEVVAVRGDEDDEIIDIADDEPLPAFKVEDVPQEEVMTHKGSSDQNSEARTLQPVPEPTVEPSRHKQPFNHKDPNRQDHENLELSDEQAQKHLIDRDTVDQPQKSNTQGSNGESNLGLHPDGQPRHDSPLPVASNIISQPHSQDPEHTSNDSSKVYGQRLEEADSISSAPLATEVVRETFEQHEPPPASPDENAEGQNDEPTDQYEDLSKPTAYIHPVIVLYEGAELSLFRPADGDQDFLLEDEDLISDSIDKLLAACRPILGEDVRDDELVIGVEDLHLEISEFANNASGTTLAQLVDIYLQLQHHDGIETPPEFHLKLFTRPSLSHRLNFLRNAVEEGKGLSEVKGLHNGQEGEAYTLPDPQDKYEDTGENHEASVSVKYDLNEQNHEDGKETADQGRSAVPQAPPTLKEQSTLYNTETYAGVETISEPATGALKPVKKADKTIVQNIENQVAEQIDIIDFEARGMNDSLKREKQLQEKQEPAPINDEDIIEYEDEEAAGSKSSSGSSTLHGDVDTTAEHTLSLSDQPLPTKDGKLLETETSSHTVEGSVNDLASYSPHANGEGDDGYNTEDRHEGKKEAQDREVDENVEADGQEFEAIEQEDGSQFAGGEGHPADVEVNPGGDNQEYDGTFNENEYQTSFEDYRGTEYQVQEHQLSEYQSERIQPEPLGSNHGEDYVEDPTKLEVQATYNQTVVDADPRVDDNLAAQDYEDAEDLEDFIGEPTAASVDEEQVDENGDSSDAEKQRAIQPTIPVEDNDEITYEDEEEPKKPSNFEQDKMPSPESLKKRPRSHPDADDTTAEDLQDAKRVRST